jgi:hypothetical protein
MLLLLFRNNIIISLLILKMCLYKLITGGGVDDADTRAGPRGGRRCRPRGEEAAGHVDAAGWDRVRRERVDVEEDVEEEV